MNVREKLAKLKTKIPSEVLLVAVSKTKPAPLIIEAYNEGHRDFGENKVQELVLKQEKLPKDIKWHFIGHLQTNKVKHIASFIHLIHAVDSIKLLKEINKQAVKNNRTINVLIQFHIAKEISKYGIAPNQAIQFFDEVNTLNLLNVKILGVMGMATYTTNQSQIRNEFKLLKNTFDTIKNYSYKNISEFKEISMGMSGDYALAIEQGSTIVRIGSSIFGNI
ncbi:MAG TPA: YggS family pyridoxal phosphate-dependent enzyme [Crocinitomix sp.]|nr:YggS family pyridoxal phosphate-dependent enzyme [Crocinitomix sp.]